MTYMQYGEPRFLDAEASQRSPPLRSSPVKTYQVPHAIASPALPSARLISRRDSDVLDAAVSPALSYLRFICRRNSSGRGRSSFSCTVLSSTHPWESFTIRGCSRSLALLSTQLSFGKDKSDPTFHHGCGCVLLLESQVNVFTAFTCVSLKIYSESTLHEDPHLKKVDKYGVRDYLRLKFVMNV